MIVRMSETIYAWARVRRVKSEHALACAEHHGKRVGPGVGHCDPSAPEPTRAYSRYAKNPLDLVSAVREATKAQGACRRRRASVCMEVHLFLSPEFFKPTMDGPRFDPAKVAQFDRYVRSFAELEFPEAVAAIRLDLDETTPHAALFVVPVSERRTKLGRIKREVSVRDRFGRRWQLSALQTSFANHMKPLGAVRGIPKSETGHDNVYFRDYHIATHDLRNRVDAEREIVAQKDAGLADERAKHEAEAKAEREALTREETRLASERAKHEISMNAALDALARKEVQLADERAKYERSAKVKRESLERERAAFHLAMKLIGRKLLFLGASARGPELRVMNSITAAEKNLLAAAVSESPVLKTVLLELCKTASAADLSGGGGGPPKPVAASRKAQVANESPEAPPISPGPGI